MSKPEEGNKDDAKKDDAKSGSGPWYKSWPAIALGILFIGLATAIVFPELGRGLGNGLGYLGAGYNAFARGIGVEPRTLLFIIAAGIFAIRLSLIPFGKKKEAAH
jgi:hypothetical protein